MSLLKSVKRAAKDKVMGYTETELRVRAATSNDKTPISSSDMEDIARATYDLVEYPKLFSMVWKRLTDSETPLHVNKALILTDYLLRTGADRFVQDVKLRENDVTKLFTFGRFQPGEDLATCESIRNKSKALHAFFTNEKALQEARKVAEKIKEVKYTHISSESVRGDYSAQSDTNSMGSRSRRASSGSRPGDDPFAPASRGSFSGGSFGSRYARAGDRDGSIASGVEGRKRTNSTASSGSHMSSGSHASVASAGSKSSSNSKRSSRNYDDPFKHSANDPFASSKGRVSPEADPFAAPPRSGHSRAPAAKPLVATASPAPSSSSSSAPAQGLPKLAPISAPSAPVPDAPDTLDLFEKPILQSRPVAPAPGFDLIGASKPTTAAGARQLVNALVKEEERPSEEPGAMPAQRSSVSSVSAPAPAPRPDGDLWNLTELANIDNLAPEPVEKPKPKPSLSVGASLQELRARSPSADSYNSPPPQYANSAAAGPAAPVLPFYNPQQHAANFSYAPGVGSALYGPAMYPVHPHAPAHGVPPYYPGGGVPPVMPSNLGAVNSAPDPFAGVAY